MSDTPNINELREKLRKLDDLLANPEPGLMTWRRAYEVRVRELLAFWNLGLPEDD